MKLGFLLFYFYNIGGGGVKFRFLLIFVDGEDNIRVSFSKNGMKL